MIVQKVPLYLSVPLGTYMMLPLKAGNSYWHISEGLHNHIRVEFLTSLLGINIQPYSITPTPYEFVKKKIGFGGLSKKTNVIFVAVVH